MAASTSSIGQGRPELSKQLLLLASGDPSTPHFFSSLLEDGDLQYFGTTPRLGATRLGTTPRGNTCLHISSMHGLQEFCWIQLQKKMSLLLSYVNLDGETPLVIAAARGHASLASFLLGQCCVLSKWDAILRQDSDGCNALHHAIRSGHKDLALELISNAPALARPADKNGESPLFIAVMRNWEDVVSILLDIPDSAHSGPGGFNALHAGVRNGNPGIIAKLLEKRPQLATKVDTSGTTTEIVAEQWDKLQMDGFTPTGLAVYWDKIHMLRVLLEHDHLLGYAINNNNFPLLFCAAHRGHVGAARELLKHCPDAPYREAEGLRWTCLHKAVWEGHTKFVKFILKTPQLQHLVNMRDAQGKTALHFAVHKRNPEIVRALLSHKDINTTLTDITGWPAAWELWNNTSHAKTLNWNEVRMLMLKADPRGATSLYTLHEETKQKATDESRKNAKSLTETYTSNTSLVAILMATITFAAAFTVPGGYSGAAGSEGLPIMSRKITFQAFLISDTLAMCSSFAVAFICIIARWEDYEFLVYYRSFTKKLMWFAYIATTVAFSTGLYTVLAPRLHWLAIMICSLVASLPILTKLLGEWPILKLKFRLGRTFKSYFLDIVLCSRKTNMLDMV